MSLTFSEYATPLAEVPYSNEYFRELTFNATALLDYPAIAAPRTCFQEWTFLDSVPGTIEGSMILPGEVVPNLVDLLPVSRELPDAFAAGKRSIAVMVLVDMIPICKVYHFSKIRLCILLNNNQIPVQYARQVHYQVTNLNLLSAKLLCELGHLSINAPIHGFHVTMFPLWKLGCLLGEHWLEEDVVNAMSELLYFRQAVTSIDVKPNFIFLPTLFYNDAKFLYGQTPRTYSHNLVELRERIRAIRVDLLSFLTCEGDHYSAFNYQQGQLEHGDTFGNVAAEHVLTIFNWILLDLDYATPVAVTERDVPGQDFSPGSCGVAAFNFVETRADPVIPQWTDSTSPQFRGRALGDLLRYHLISVKHPGGYSDWVKLWNSNDTVNQTNDVADGPVGYNDYNLHIPLALHPIHHFLDKEKCSEARSAAPGLRSSIVIRKRSLSVAALGLITPSVKPIISQPFLNALHRINARPITNFVKVDSTRRRRLDIPLATVCALPLAQTFKAEIVDTSVLDLTLGSSPSSQLEVGPSKREVKRERLPPLILDLTQSQYQSLAVVSHTKKKPKVEQFGTAWTTLMSTQVTRNRGPTVIVISDDETSPMPVSPDLHRQSGKCHDHYSITPSPVFRPLHVSAEAPIQPLFSVLQPVRSGAVFQTEELCRDAVYAYQEALGHRWRTGQSKLGNDGSKRKQTLRCNHYYHHKPTHNPSIDPTDHRVGRSIKTGCSAHVNMSRVQGSQMWHITLTNWDHNHDREIPVGGQAPQRPTVAQQDVIRKFSTTGNFNRDQIKTIVHDHFPDHHLEPRQITNVMNNARLEARREVERLGGDVPTIVSTLQRLKDEDPSWSFDLRLDEFQTVVGLWWQSPIQAGLTRRYTDLLINDNTYNRNQYGYPLNIGIGVDNLGHSRNLWYAIHQSEDLDTHNWVFRLHLVSAGRAPEAVFSDRHPSLIASIIVTMPLSWHFYCLYHLNGNVTLHIRSSLGSEWDDFKRDFWTVYRAVSPEEFDRLWNALLLRYPTAANYLQEELYPCRERWAWAWISTVFTAGIRTNGRVEVENRINKVFGGPKKTLFQLFTSLNERTSSQTAQEMIQVRDSSRRQHNHNLEAIFTGPLKLLRKYGGPFALQTSFKQMQLSFYYHTDVVQLPQGVNCWEEYILAITEEKTFTWENDEQNAMLNGFTNDSACISTQWLLRLVSNQGLRVQHLLRVVHLATRAVHMLAILPNNRYICDCCMGINLGVPCRHFFQAWTTFKGLEFHIALIRPRWYQDPDSDISAVAGVTFEHKPTSQELDISVLPLPPHLFSNPLDMVHRPQMTTPPPATRTLGARAVNHEAQAALRPLLESVRTQEDLNEVVEQLRELKAAQNEAAIRDRIHDPPLLNPKGRPRTARITGPLEGRARGGGAGNLPMSSEAGAELRVRNTQPDARGLIGLVSTKASRKCTLCRKEGHNRARCPLR